MNLVLDDAEEISIKKNTSTPLGNVVNLSTKLKNKKWEIIFKPNHHYAHAACGYYQAPVNFEKCLIFS